MNLAWSDTSQVSPFFPVPCTQDSPVCLTDYSKEPQVFLVSECEFSKKNLVGLACLVFGNQPLEISWDSTTKYKTERTFLLKRNGGNYVMSSQLSLETSELNGTHTCVTKINSKLIIKKTFQLPGECPRTMQKDLMGLPIAVLKD